MLESPISDETRADMHASIVLLLAITAMAEECRRDEADITDLPPCVAYPYVLEVNTPERITDVLVNDRDDGQDDGLNDGGLDDDELNDGLYDDEYAQDSVVPNVEDEMTSGAVVPEEMSARRPLPVPEESNVYVSRDNVYRLSNVDEQEVSRDASNDTVDLSDELTIFERDYGAEQTDNSTQQRRIEFIEYLNRTADDHEDV